MSPALSAIIQFEDLGLDDNSSLRTVPNLDSLITIPRSKVSTSVALTQVHGYEERLDFDER